MGGPALSALAEPEGRAPLGERGKSAGPRLLALGLALLLVLIATLRAVTPPAATGRPTDFSAERAMADVRALALRPHPAGSVDSLRVREYLYARLSALGLSPDTRRYMMDAATLARVRAWNKGRPVSDEIVDVIGLLPGRDRTLPAVALMAHYDTVPGSPGADDAAAVATLLETVRALKARGPLRRDVLLLFSDAGEAGHAGSRAFWSGDALAGHVGTLINLAALGTGGRALPIETGAESGPAWAFYGRTVANPLASTLALRAYAPGPAGTDFGPWRAGGGQGFTLALVGRPAYHHSPRASADRLDPQSVQELGGQALDLTAGLASAETLPGRGADRAVFDVGGRFLVVQRPGAGWWLLIGAAALLGLAWRRVQRIGAAPDLLAGAGGLVWLVAHARLALTAFGGSGEGRLWLLLLAALTGWAALRQTRPRMWGAAPAALLAVLGLALGAPAGSMLGWGLLAAAAGLLAPRHGASLWGGWLPALGLLLLVALVAQWKAPLLAWPFTWPVLILSAGAAIVAWADPGMRRPLTPWVSAAAALLVTPPLLALAHLLFPALPLGGLALLPVLAAAWWPLVRWPKRAPPYKSLP